MRYWANSFSFCFGFRIFPCFASVHLTPASAQKKTLFIFCVASSKSWVVVVVAVDVDVVIVFFPSFYFHFYKLFRFWPNATPTPSPRSTFSLWLAAYLKDIVNNKRQTAQSERVREQERGKRKRKRKAPLVQTLYWRCSHIHSPRANRNYFKCIA